MRSRRTFILLLIATALVTSMILPFIINDNGNVNATGDGTDADPFLIYDAKDLSMIGKGTADNGYEGWDLDAYYKLANDIAFDPNDPQSDTNGGESIDLEITYDSDQLTVAVSCSPSDIASLHVWFGTENAGSSAPDLNNVNIAVPNESGTYTMAIGGKLNDGTPFAYALEIDTTGLNSGTVMSTEFNSNGNFDPIGSVALPFTGTLDGGGYNIIGMDIAVFDSDNEAYAGLFGNTDRATIKDMGLKDGRYLAVSSSIYNTYAGGIAGYAGESIIKSCYNTCDVIAASEDGSAYAGGMAGYIDDSSSVKNCYNTGNVTVMGSGYVYGGGIAGFVKSDIENCYNRGDVTATSPNARAGGITGVTESLISYCYNTGGVEAIPTQEGYAGGITGTTDSSIVSSYFFDRNGLEITGDGYISTDNSGSRIEDEMKDENTYENWDFNDTWSIINSINDGYPVIKHFFITTVTFNGNGADSGSTDAMTGTEGETIQLPENGFVRDGYTFLGWDTNSTATTAGYASGEDYVIPADDVTLYAIWETSTYTVIVKPSENGTVECPDGPFSYGTEVKLTITPADGYRTASVTDNGKDVYDKVGTDGIYVVTVDGDHEIVVTFESTSSGPVDPADDDDLSGNDTILVAILIIFLIMILILAYIILRR